MALSSTAKTYLVSVALAAALIGGAFLLAPGREESQAMSYRAALEQGHTHMANGRPDQAARDFERALADRPKDHAIAQKLLTSYAAAGELDAHFKLLTKLAAEGGLTEQPLREAIGLYQTAGMEKERAHAQDILNTLGFATVEDLTARVSAAIEAGDTNAATAMARTLINKTSAIEPQLGARIVETSIAGGAMDTANTAIARWFGPGRDAATLAIAATALTQRGYPLQSLAILANAPESAKLELAPLRMAALKNAAVISRPHRVELTKLLFANATAEPLSTSARKAAIDELFARGELSVISAKLTASGAWRQPPWRAPFLFALKARGQSEEAAQLLSAEAAYSYEDGLLAAQDLASMDMKDAASSTLKALSARSGAAGQAVEDLLYLWNSAPALIDLGWIATQAAAARSADELERWATIAHRVGGLTGSFATLDAAAQAPSADIRGRAALLRARYLGWDGPSPALTNALRAAKTETLARNEQEELTKLACAVGEESTAFALIEKLEAGGKSSGFDACFDRFTLSSARAAAAKGEPMAARVLYAALRQPEASMTAYDYFDYAQALRAAGADASAPLQAALSRIDDGRDRPANPSLLRGLILTQLSRRDDAITALTQALAANPGDDRVRLMLGELLIDNGSPLAALQIACPDGCAARSFARRFDLRNAPTELAGAREKSSSGASAATVLTGGRQ